MSLSSSSSTGKKKLIEKFPWKVELHCWRRIYGCSVYGGSKNILSEDDENMTIREKDSLSLKIS